MRLGFERVGQLMEPRVECLAQPAMGHGDLTGEIEHMIELVNVHAHGIGADSSLPPYGAVLAIIRT